MGFFDKVKEISGSVSENVAKAASGAADKTKVTIEKTKLKGQIKTEKTNIEKQYAEIGKKYFELMGHNPSEDYAPMVDIINESLNKINVIQQQLDALEAENTCPHCGTVLKKDQQFCQTCGAKQECYVEVPISDVEVVSQAVDEAETAENNMNL